MGYLDEAGLAALVGKVKGQMVELTAEEYAQIDPAIKNYDNKLYFVKNDVTGYQIDNEPVANSDGLVKSGGIYNWTSKIGSGTLITTAQTLIPAVNEVNAKIGSTNISSIGDGTVTGAVNALNTGLTSANNSINYLLSITNHWEAITGTVGDIAQTFYRKEVGNNVYVIFGAGSVQAGVGPGATSQRQIVYSSRPFSAVLGGAANLALAGLVDSQMRYCTIGRDRVDAWVYNPTAATIATVMYNFIVIGIPA